MEKKVIITGATGMVGGLVLEYCLNHADIERVISLGRKKTGMTSEKLTEIVIDDALNLDAATDYILDIDIVYYCLGVYTGAADRETFRKITVDYPETLAKAVIDKNPEARFCLLSGTGADRKEKSRMMFAKDKGVIENRLSKMGFAGFHTFRPGYIYPVTPRKEPNISYKISRALYPLIKRLSSGFSIQSTELAAAMVEVGLNGCEREILENREILSIIR